MKVSKIYLVSWGFIKWLFKCSKINKLGNFGFFILRFWPRTPTCPYYSQFLRILLCNLALKHSSQCYAIPLFIPHIFQLLTQFFFNEHTITYKCQMINGLCYLEIISGCGIKSSLATRKGLFLKSSTLQTHDF